jgi:hypothetical protein
VAGRPRQTNFRGQSMEPARTINLTYRGQEADPPSPRSQTGAPRYNDNSNNDNSNS